MVVKISLGMSLMCMLMVYGRKRISGLVVHQMDLENKEIATTEALKVFVLLRRKTKKRRRVLQKCNTLVKSHGFLTTIYLQCYVAIASAVAGQSLPLRW